MFKIYLSSFNFTIVAIGLGAYVEKGISGAWILAVLGILEISLSLAILTVTNCISDIPEAITALIGASFIILSIFSSKRIKTGPEN